MEESKIIDFNEGIPGFPQLKKFTLMADEKDKDSEGLFYWLQSIDNTDVAFVLVNMVKILPNYNPLVERSEIDALGEYKEDDFNFYNIAILPDDVKEMTVNLKAPIVINTKERKGRQVVCTNEDYDVRHYMFK